MGKPSAGAPCDCDQKTKRSRGPGGQVPSQLPQHFPAGSAGAGGTARPSPETPKPSRSAGTFRPPGPPARRARRPGTRSSDPTRRLPSSEGLGTRRRGVGTEKRSRRPEGRRGLGRPETPHQGPDPLRPQAGPCRSASGGGRVTLGHPAGHAARHLRRGGWWPFLEGPVVIWGSGCGTLTERDTPVLAAAGKGALLAPWAPHSLSPSAGLGVFRGAGGPRLSESSETPSGCRARRSCSLSSPGGGGGTRVPATQADPISR